MNKTPRDEGRGRASDMRDKAMAMAMKRKEEYLGARVPKALKERVIQKADEMSIPVSLLIRRLLEQTFPEGNSTNPAAIIDEHISDKLVSTTAINVVSTSKDKYADIIGWKEIEINQDRSCERCKEPLPKGSTVSLGFTSNEVGYVIVCSQCKSQLM